MRTPLIGIIALLSTSFVLKSLQVEAASELTGQERAEAASRGLVGSLAPKLVLKTIDGDTIDLGSLYGKKAVYLEFWATWCIPCREQMPHLERTYRSAGPDLAVIAVNAGFDDSLAEVQKFRRQFSLTAPIVIDDGKLGEAFHLRVTPQHIVIGRDGRVQYVGHLADERLDAALQSARTARSAGMPPSTAGMPGSTPGYGVGDHLPNISATMLDGHLFRSLDPRTKRPTVLVFLSPWCESYLAPRRADLSTRCRQVRKQIDSLAQDTDVRWLGIASRLWATRDDLSDYQAQYKVKIPLALDESGVWFRSFRVMNVPTVLIADADGKIVRRVEGFDAHFPEKLKDIARKMQ